MSKFYGYDEAMENDIAKITTPKLALMSDVVAYDKKFIPFNTVIIPAGKHRKY